jgi:hypothetical protein
MRPLAGRDIHPYAPPAGGIVTVSNRKSPTRFRGFSAEIPRFFETLAADPCPDGWPADVRVTYAAHVLSPLKALVTDLEERLSDISAFVALEARVGASLSWPRGRPSAPDDCPVSRVRAWARGLDPDSSPLLYADFSAPGIEIGLAAAGGDPAATSRVRRSIASDDGLRGIAADLLAAGWVVSGEAPAADAGSLAADLRPWAWESLRVTRVEPWSEWVEEPAFTSELAARFRELLPLFERMVEGVQKTARRPATIPDA